MITDRSLYSGRDIGMYFNGCYVAVKQSDGTLKPYRFEDASGTECILGGIDGDSTCIEFSDERLCLDWPTLGVVDNGKSVINVYMSGSRQYKKALSRNHHDISYPMDYEEGVLGLHRGNSLDECIYDMYNPTDRTLQEGIDALRDRIAVRLDRNFFVCVKAGYDNPLLGYHGDIVGEIVDGRIRLSSFADNLSKRVGKFGAVEIVEQV
jgi:hypothetical protein